MIDFNKPINEGYDFNGSEFVSEAWSMFKKEAGSFIGVTILFIVISTVLSFIPIINLVSSFVQGALFAGYLLFASNMRRGTHKMSDFFGGFKYFGQIALYYIVIFLMFVPLFLIVFSIMFPFELLMNVVSGDLPMDEFWSELANYLLSNMSTFFVTWLLFLAVVIYISLSYSLAFPLMVNGNLGFWQAMEISRKTVAKSFFSFFGFYLLYGLIAIVLIPLTLFLGILVLYPLAFLVSFVMYERIFGVENLINDEIE